MNQTPFAVRAVIPLVTMVLGATAGLGCALETASEDDNVAETQQEFGRWFWSWGTTAGPDLDLGSDIGKTCFLAGVAGNLSVGLNTGSLNPRAEARVYRSGGKYWLRARANQYGTGTTPVMAHAACVPWTTGRTGEFLWQTGEGEKRLAGTAGKECFLTGLSGQAGTWDEFDDFARLLPTTGDWLLSADVPGQGYFFTTSAQVRAVCFNLPSGVRTQQIAQLYPAPPQNVHWDGYGSACGLVIVKGSFNTNSWSDGALFFWPDSVPGWWQFSVKGIASAYGTCMY